RPVQLLLENDHRLSDRVCLSPATLKSPSKFLDPTCPSRGKRFERKNPLPFLRQAHKLSRELDDAVLRIITDRKIFEARTRNLVHAACRIRMMALSRMGLRLKDLLHPE